MAERTAQSKISPLDIRTRGGGTTVKGVPRDGTKRIFTATKITITTEKNSDGTPVILREVIRYSDAKGSDPVVIAKGSTRDGEQRFEYTSDATADERKNETLVKNTSKQQSTTVEKTLNLDSAEKDEFSDLINKSNANPESAASSAAADIEGIGNIPGTGRKNFPQDLIYPLDLGTQKQDVLKINMLEYKPRKRDGIRINDRRDPNKESDNKIIGSVILPIPGGISDKNACRWGEASGNVFQLAAANVLTNELTGEGGTGKAVKNALEELRGGRQGITQALASAFASNATGVRNVLTRQTGAIINPNLELLFEQPTLRPFQFQFTMSPRSDVEAKRVAKIIRFFKQGSAPIRSQERLFLKSPHTFQLQYIHKNESEQPFLNKFKECALTSIDVNYTPNGTYSTYEDGSMTSYQITLAFQELEPVFNDDYEENTLASFREDPAENAALQSDIPSRIGF